jgi:hypothetical protein
MDVPARLHMSRTVFLPQRLEQAFQLVVGHRLILP